MMRRRNQFAINYGCDHILIVILHMPFQTFHHGVEQINKTGNAKVTCVNPINLAAEELYNCAGEGDRAVQCTSIFDVLDRMNNRS